MNQDLSKPERDDSQPSPAEAETDKLDAAARRIVELALLEARAQVARSCGA